MKEPVVIPQEGYLRAWQIVGCPKRGVAPLIPISKSLWWKKVAEGEYPAGVLLGRRTRAWSAASIRKLLADLEAAEGGVR
jgi:prophage regulatory protein